jgi:23S rRNA U2552 (ribose-2'-O)-methylase RlmE/FtsJ
MSTPWALFVYHDRTVHSLARQYQTESYEQKHEYEDEERQLHAHRNRIQVYEASLPPGRNWEYYKKAVNPYEWVYSQKKYPCFPDSVCPIRPLSRSYFKMVEILALSGFFEGIRTFRTAHVCEGPGGFIEAIYDEAQKRGATPLTTMAMTLRSRNPHVPSWKKAAQFLRRHRTVQILYGEDGTGDILKPENQEAFVDATEKVDLFTADGGFDVSRDYEKQEQLVFPLLLASVRMGLEVVKKGGMFVLKVFDVYHPATTDLMYFLSCHFEQWALYKPGMSRPCNPEHYFIGRGFVGCTEEALDAMRLWCLILERQPLDRLFRDMTYMPSFQEWLAEHRTRAYQHQIEHLERVFEMIERERAGRELTKQDLVVHQERSLAWCRQFQIPCASPPL